MRLLLEKATQKNIILRFQIQITMAKTKKSWKRITNFLFHSVYLVFFCDVHSAIPSRPTCIYCFLSNKSSPLNYITIWQPCPAWYFFVDNEVILFPKNGYFSHIFFILKGFFFSQGIILYFHHFFMHVIFYRILLKILRCHSF